MTQPLRLRMATRVEVIAQRLQHSADLAAMLDDPTVTVTLGDAAAAVAEALARLQALAATHPKPPAAARTRKDPHV